MGGYLIQKALIHPCCSLLPRPRRAQGRQALVQLPLQFQQHPVIPCSHKPTHFFIIHDVPNRSIQNLMGQLGPPPPLLQLPDRQAPRRGLLRSLLLLLPLMLLLPLLAGGLRGGHRLYMGADRCVSASNRI